MKSWAEERKTGSVELLLTMPFSEWDLVLGKFLSAYALLAAMLLLTIPLPLSLLPMGSFDAGVIVAEYFGLLLLGSSAVSLGVLLSALSKNQAGSFLGTAVVLMATMLLGRLAFGLDLPFWLNETVNFFSLPFHFESFSRGVLDSRGIAYYIAGTALFLFLATRVILYRKWG
jgi:ABC-2 type transport system permease protein